MANIKQSLPVLDGYGSGKLFIVGKFGSDFAAEADRLFPNEFLGEDLIAAVAACVDGRGDTILVGPGTYTLTTVLNIQKDDVTIKAAHVNPVSPTVKITSSLADTVEVEADHVRFEGIEFEAGADACTNLINVADTVAVVGFEVENCVFDPNGKASVIAIGAADATYAMTQARITNNVFLKGFDTAAINIGVLGMGNSLIENNFFQITAAKVGIALADTTAFATGYGARVQDNTFLGADATGDEVGVSVAGTENTTGAVVFLRNLFVSCAAASITADKLTGTIINNYTVTDQGSGGALLDTSS